MTGSGSGSSLSPLNLKLALFALLPFFAHMSLAACYPTHPIATTVLVAGQPAKVRWVEDNRQPLLHQIALMDIHLLARNDTFVAFIGRSINALALNTTVSIPTKLPPNLRQYTLRFVPAGWKVHSGGIAPSYSATFTIIPNIFTPPKPTSQANSTGAHAQNVTNSEHGTGSTLSQPTMAHITNMQPLPTSTNTAQTASEGHFAPGSQLTGGTMTFRWPRSQARKLQKTTDLDAGRTGLLSDLFGVAILAVIGDLDMVEVVLRLVSITWPAFVGLSLAI